ncbi:MAG: histidinol dehydrogenase [Planctomycetia bacterium]|nr:histidinol dehydrogenase [Planctomycetia bacterium]
MKELRRKLSPRGNVVSESGKQRTIEIFGEPLTPQRTVERICDDVRESGLSAVLDYSRRIDHAELTAETLRVPLEELKAAHAAADPEFLAAIRRVRDRIVRFQSAILHRDVRIEVEHGYLCQWYRPLRRVGCCVPGGAAAYPSSVLMNCVPAQIAGVEEIAVIAPPTPTGSRNPDMLATCYEIGIREVYRIGGAQGVASLAYGITDETGRPIIPGVDKIVGPGNLFVALAKRYVSGEVGIDSIAGPSEVVVIVDSTTRADYTAYDLLAQAEHAPGASILIGWEESSLDRVEAEIVRRFTSLERGELARHSLESFGAMILARDEEDACRLTDEIAPEHLHIATENAADLARKIRNAGAMFLGNFSPVALGDYAAGPSHTLPTSGTARFASGLSANDFLRPHSVQYFDPKGLELLEPDVYQLATKEGLTAHRASVEIRRSRDVL